MKVHRDEVEFLRYLSNLLESTSDLEGPIQAVHQRLNSLEHGLSTRPKSPTTTPDQIEDSSSSTDAITSPLQSSLSASSEQHASKVRTVELLAWGRHAGTCFPHRGCQCRSIRPYAEIVSINADLQWSGIKRSHAQLPHELLLPIIQAKALLQFHFDYILWHHNVFHAPTFLAQCEEFWENGTVSHPLWISLYLSMMSVSCLTMRETRLNAFTEQHLLGVFVDGAQYRPS